MITKETIAELRASAMRGNDITPLLCDVLTELLALPALAPPVEPAAKPQAETAAQREADLSIPPRRVYPPYPNLTPDVRTIDPGARPIGPTEPPGGRPL